MPTASQHDLPVKAKEEPARVKFDSEPPSGHLDGAKRLLRDGGAPLRNVFAMRAIVFGTGRHISVRQADPSSKPCQTMPDQEVAVR